MKTQHYYTPEFESTLIMMDADEFINWLKDNEIIYNRDLIDVILEFKTE